MENKMGKERISFLIWKMGLPMIISMVLQAVYNIVDTAFVINMGTNGTEGNLALTYAFPIQLLMIAVGVGTGVGINALLSKKLGEGDKETVNRTVGNGIFIALILYVIFMLFGFFGAGAFIRMQADGNPVVIEMGTQYLKICTILSFGSIGYTVYERFLQATGKTMFSTIAQISGALTNIVLDYVFIYPLGMGIAGAAYATVIGQVVSLALAMIFHYACNKEIKNGIRYVLPKGNIIKGIYQIGISAMLMQGLLSVMMLAMNMILGTSTEYGVLLQGAFGIYYKIQQFALFACFGLSNTLISVISYNFGMRDKIRVKQGIKWGVIDALGISVLITILFQILAEPIARLFGMASGTGSDEVIRVCIQAMRIATIGYVFMGFSVAVQGIEQAFHEAGRPLILALLRLVVFLLPVAYLLLLTEHPDQYLWWAFPIAECLTAVIGVIFLMISVRKHVAPMENVA